MSEKDGMKLPGFAEFLADPVGVSLSLSTAFKSIAAIFHPDYLEGNEEAVRDLLKGETVPFLQEHATWVFAEADKRQLRPFSVLMSMIYIIYGIDKSLTTLLAQEAEIAKKLGFTEEDYNEVFANVMKTLQNKDK